MGCEPIQAEREDFPCFKMEWRYPGEATAISI